MSNTQKTLLERIKAMPTPSNYPLIAAILTEAATEIDHLLARVAELEAMVTPKPIESAPKDKRVLVHFDATKDGFCYWEQAVFVDGKWDIDIGVDPFDVATHWLPLPPDPTEVTE
jgi:hypothetical protein